jgi:hypothetical protein
MQHGGPKLGRTRPRAGVTSVVQRGTPLPRPAPSTIFKPLAEGGVLFSTSTEVYFGVNVIGARIWELLPPATATFEELCATLAAQYHDVSEAQIRRDVKAFLDDLLSNDLVVAAPKDDEADPSVSDRSP